MKKFCLHLLLGTSLLVVAGCKQDSQPIVAPVPADAPPLRLLVIGDPNLAKVVKREWDARSEGELMVRELTEEAFQKWDQPRLAAEAVLFPSSFMGELAGRDWLAPLPHEAFDDPVFQFREVFAATRKQELTWDEDAYAVPLGGPPLLLFYRRDIFERLEVQPPRTWAEYFQASERLASRERVKEFLTSPDAKWFGTCEPLKGQWAAQIVLARAAPYAKHRSQFSAIFDYRTMNPLVDGPPFARALRELVDASRFFPAEATQCSPSDAVKLLHDGQCAMAIGWLADTKDWPAVTSPTPSLDIGVVPLPGSADVYNFRSAAWEQRGNEESHYVPLIGVSGRLGSLTKECRQPAAATRLLTWLSSPEMSVQISSASSSTGPFRESHLTQVKHWTGPLLSAEIVSRYAEAIRQSLSEPNCLCGLRIPRHQEYLSALSDATRSVVSGNAAAEVSLQEVAKRWNEITESSDREKQRHAYMRSIGLKP